jgi:microcystin-dependent protein
VSAPQKPDLDYSYAGFSQGLGDGTFPGAQLDNDMAEIKQSIDETIDFTSQIIRSDGKLQSGVVTRDALDSSVLLGVAPPRPWATNRAYLSDETVTFTNSLYICRLAHTSTDFASANATGRWGLIAEFTVESSVLDGGITTSKLANNSVTVAKLANNAVTVAKLADASVTSAKLAVSLSSALTPIGAEVDFLGAFSPAGWVFAFGQAVSRSTYSVLFGVLCPSAFGVTTTGSNVIALLDVNFRFLGLEGSAIEGANIPAGTTITSITATTITMSQAATGSALGVQVRLFPHGNGDGATTFTLPDARGRATIGRGGMGGTVAGRPVVADEPAADYEVNRLGATGQASKTANRIIYTGVA